MSRVILDEPELQRDDLNRRRFAHTIYQVIETAPLDWPLRIGVYGAWGEGKTTVLRYVEELADRHSVPVVWFNPWAATDRTSLWKAFDHAVRARLRARRSLRQWALLVALQVVRFSKTATEAIVKWFPSAADIVPLEGIFREMTEQLIRQRVTLSQAEVNRHLKLLPGARRLIVIIDDVDRASPALVPQLLLALREMFDISRCAFIVALDPRIVAKAFPEVHPGWGTTIEFIEKIIQFPFWLPTPKRKELIGLTSTILDALPLRVDRAAVSDLVDVLPSNPRRLKQFFRNLLRMRGILERHDPDEIRWPLLLGLELIRSASPNIAAELFRSESFRDNLVRLTMFSRGSAAGEIRQQADNQLQEETKGAFARLGLEADEPLRRSIDALVTSFGERTGPIVRELLDYWIDLAEDPPIFTWREFRALFARWKEAPDLDHLVRLAEQHSWSIKVPRDSVLADLFRTTVAYRGERLHHAADANLAAELEEQMAEAFRALSLLRLLIVDAEGFARTPPLLGFEEFKALYEQANRWAHFRNRDVYVTARADERELLLRAAADGCHMAVQMLAAFQLWLPFGREHRREAEQLRAEVIEAFVPCVVVDLRGRFARDNGIGALWGHSRAPVEKYFLFRRESPFFSAEMVDYLRELSRAAADHPPIQENFLEFLRMLRHGLQQGLGPVSPDTLLSLAADQQIIGVVWNGATARALQPRTIGSLRETRAILARVGGTEDHLALPEWWDEVQEVQEAEPLAERRAEAVREQEAQRQNENG